MTGHPSQLTCCITYWVGLNIYNTRHYNNSEASISEAINVTNLGELLFFSSDVFVLNRGQIFPFIGHWIAQKNVKTDGMRKDILILLLNSNQVHVL